MRNARSTAPLHQRRFFSAPLVLVALSALLAGTGGCKDDEVVYDTIYLRVTSEVAVQKLEVRLRSGSGSDRKIVAPDDQHGTSITLGAGKDLTSGPLTIRIEPTGAPQGVVDLMLVGLSGGEVVAAYGGHVTLPSNGPLNVRLSAIDAACDGDGDGAFDCSKPGCCPGALAELGDCNDALAEVSPFAAKLPDCIPCEAAPDYFCDGEAYSCADSDGDGSADCLDCAKDDKTIYPGGPELCGNGKDDNCDGQEDEGWLFYDGTNGLTVGSACGQGPCAGGTVSCDNDLKVPLCTSLDLSSDELCGDGIDNDCDGSVDEGCKDGDWDGDGSTDDDCAPYDAAWHPGAYEPCCDPSLPEKQALATCDRNCDGEVTLCSKNDKDLDGFSPPDDCNDGDSQVWPGAPERCGDGVDQSCDGVDPACDDPLVVDTDDDGWVVPEDCDDQDAQIHPWAEDGCDGVDNDCDGVTDGGNPGGGAACSPEGEPFVCKKGVVACRPQKGALECVGAELGDPEVCDGLDNDCDGDVDEGFEWNGSAVGQPCNGTGECGGGTVECVTTDNGSSGLCSTNPTGSQDQSQPEVCDSKDNDCDGQVDEELVGDVITDCDKLGVCAAGVPATCVGGQWECGYSEVVGYEQDELSCDGLDNDCDGTTDEGHDYEGIALGEACDGVGECGAGFVECAADASVATCSTNPDGSAPAVQPEDCNGKDDDCDGVIDNNLPEGADAVLAAKCNTKGVCGSPENVPTCDAGSWVCHPEDVPGYEGDAEASCDGLDNDCDGQSDEEFTWDELPIGANCDGVGACSEGVVECLGDKSGATCSTNPNGTQSEAEAEDCNGADDDCDGTVDNHLPEGAAAIIAAKCNTSGVCNSPLIAPTCVEGGWVCHPEAIPGYEADGEVSCDGLDNDCDGKPDDDFQWGDLDVAAPCDGTGSCGAGLVECLKDKSGATCSTNPDGSTPEVAFEDCNGKDDDCDGTVDNNLPTGVAAVSAASCNTGGVCKAELVVATCGGGAWSCSYDGIPDYEAGSEKTCDGKDNNCDGEKDEGFVYEGQPVGGICDGVGQCGIGSVECVGDGSAATCSTNPDGTAPGAAPEECNGKDDDCDGQVDNNLPLGADAIAAAGCPTQGVCDSPLITPTCNSGKWVCHPEEIPEYEAGTEVSCDKLDNNCDGDVDEAFVWNDVPIGEQCDGTGECGIGEVECRGDGVAATCSTNPDGTLPGGTTETCNGKDDDCDGLVDETYIELGAKCDGTDDDLCEDGVRVCNAGGTGTVCDDDPASKQEICNLLDDDCDGQIDEGFDLGQACDGDDDDLCENGSTICAQDGMSVVCNEALGTGIVEVCDGVDNNCNTVIDEGFGLGNPCEPADLADDTDSCPEIGVLACDPVTKGATCKLVSLSNKSELCNGLDDDCDTSVDEDFNLGGKCDGTDSDSCQTGHYECDSVDLTKNACVGDIPCAALANCVTTGSTQQCQCGDGEACNTTQGTTCAPGVCRCGDTGESCDGFLFLCEDPGGGFMCVEK